MIAIRPCTAADVDAIRAVCNDAARAYRGVIPDDRWSDPYMTETHLRSELRAGVGFVGAVDDGVLVAVMGLQAAGDVALIRHAYTRTLRQGHGLGGRLLAHLQSQTDRPLLVGTWRAATWAVRFYERHGFQRVDDPRPLLQRYWDIGERQIDESVVLADDRWFVKQTRPARATTALEGHR
jgi:GNAT superfamily N-acetyltransferase